MPQLSHHQDWFGRLSIDATAALPDQQRRLAKPPTAG